MSWAHANPAMFPGVADDTNYSRFPPGEIGTTLGTNTYSGTVSTPEAQFQIPPGDPIPAAWKSNIGNMLGPGGTPNQAPPTPTGILSESAAAAAA